MSCSTCFEDFDEEKYVPLNLECGHTFCRSCIQEFLKAQKIECPQCRTVSWIENLPVRQHRQSEEELPGSEALPSDEGNEAALRNVRRARVFPQKVPVRRLSKRLLRAMPLVPSGTHLVATELLRWAKEIRSFKRSWRALRRGCWRRRPNWSWRGK